MVDFTLAHCERERDGKTKENMRTITPTSFLDSEPSGPRMSQNVHYIKSLVPVAHSGRSGATGLSI